MGQSALHGSQSVLLWELFETRYGSTAIVFSRELDVMVLDGTTPFIATALVAVAVAVAVADDPWLVVRFITVFQHSLWRALTMAAHPHPHDANASRHGLISATRAS
ncbi:hypothetical protein [Streptomyces sp. NPDC127119]|uniref:hypothetical protein n=1 Tax=Streptomyces sp. NPDC127119 TaxID=3345370 RepID=UPI00363240BB